MNTTPEWGRRALRFARRMRSGSAAGFAGLTAGVMLTACAQGTMREPSTLPDLPASRPMATTQTVGTAAESSFAWCDAAACPHPSRLDSLRSRGVASKARFEAAAAAPPAGDLSHAIGADAWADLVGHAGSLCGLHLRFEPNRADLSRAERRRLSNWMGHRDASSEPYVVVLSMPPGARPWVSPAREQVLRDAILTRAPHAAVRFVHTVTREPGVVVTTKADLAGARPIVATPSASSSPGSPPFPIETVALADAFDARDPRPLQEPSP